MSRRLCRESTLRAKHDEQNVKVTSRGAVGALWQRTEAETGGFRAVSGKFLGIVSQDPSDFISNRLHADISVQD